MNNIQKSLYIKVVKSVSFLIFLMVTSTYFNREEIKPCEVTFDSLGTVIIKSNWRNYSNISS